jgi:hypothetical protein
MYDIENILYDTVNTVYDILNVFMVQWTDVICFKFGACIPVCNVDDQISKGQNVACYKLICETLLVSISIV